MKSYFENLTSEIKRRVGAAIFKSFKNASEVVWAIFTFLSSRFTMVGEGFFAYSKVIQMHYSLVNILIERELSLVALKFDFRDFSLYSNAPLSDSMQAMSLGRG